MANTVNKALLQSILRKRAISEQLNNEEEAYARKMFDQMMESKKQVRKVVRIVTGEQLRKENDGEIKKGKVDAEATRKDPRYPQWKNPQTIKGENTDPDVNSLKAKIPDADNAPKAGPRWEQDRLSEMTQEAVPPRSEATAKFVAVDPVKAGDIVSKNILKEGTRIVKGIVIKVKNDVAFVKWADGRMMYEEAFRLVKVKKSEAAASASEVKEDPKLGPSDKEEDDKNPPMSKQTTRERGRRAARNVAASARQAGRRLGARVSGAVAGAKQGMRVRAAEGKRRRTAGAPLRHATRAVRELTRPRLGGPMETAIRGPIAAAREVGRAVRSTATARRAHAARPRSGKTGRSLGQRMRSGAARAARRLVRSEKVQKDGDFAVAPDYSAPGGMKTTPFQDLTNSLQDVVRLAGQLKERQERTTDQDIKNHYDGLISELREIAEKILSGLNAELDEAKSDE